jgi:hypothetical protein
MDNTVLSGAAGSSTDRQCVAHVAAQRQVGARRSATAAFQGTPKVSTVTERVS